MGAGRIDLSVSNTYSASRATVPTRPAGRLKRPDGSKHLLRAALGWARVAVGENFDVSSQSASLDEAGPGASRDSYRDDGFSFDAGGWWQVTPRWRATMAGTNLTNAPERSYEATAFRVTRNQYSSTTWRLGVAAKWFRGAGARLKSRCEGVDVVGELAVGEGGVALQGRESFWFPQHAAEGIEEAAGEMGLNDVAEDRESLARRRQAEPFEDTEDAVALVDDVDFGPAWGGGAAEVDVGGDERGQGGGFGEIGEQAGAAGGNLECLETGERELGDKFANGSRNEFEVGLPVGGSESLGGGGKGFRSRGERDPFGAVKALELDLGPVGDAVEDAAVRPGEGEGDGAEHAAGAAGDGGGAGGGAGAEGRWK